MQRYRRYKGDIYLCGNEYRIGDPEYGPPVRVRTKCGQILGHLLDHLGEDVSYDTLGEIADSTNPQTLLTGLRCQMKNSRQFKFRRMRPGRGSFVCLEWRV